MRDALASYKLARFGIAQFIRWCAKILWRHWVIGVFALLVISSPALIALFSSKDSFWPLVGLAGLFSFLLLIALIAAYTIRILLKLTGELTETKERVAQTQAQVKDTSMLIGQLESRCERLTDDLAKIAQEDFIHSGEWWNAEAMKNLPNFSKLDLYNNITDNCFDNIELKSNFNEFMGNIPTVVCVARNEQNNIERFIEHYLNLGFRSIHIIDNESEDNTAEVATSFPNVTVWSARGSYSRAAFGQMWVGAIARRFGLGKWVLNVDADELLVYSGMNCKGAAELQAILERQGVDRLVAPLIDLYAGDFRQDKNQPTKAQRRPTGNPVYDEAPYLDSFEKSYRYTEVWSGLQLRGGVRSRLASEAQQEARPSLTKVPLMLWTESTAYANAHFPCPHVRHNKKPDAALLHFKLISDFKRRIKKILSENEHFKNSKEYRFYEQWFDNKEGAIAFSENYSITYTGVETLLNEGFIGQLDWMDG